MANKSTQIGWQKHWTGAWSQRLRPLGQTVLVHLPILFLTQAKMSLRAQECNIFPTIFGPMGTWRRGSKKTSTIKALWQEQGASNAWRFFFCRRASRFVVLQTEVAHCTWVKPGRFGSFFRALFPSTWRTTVSRCFVYQDLGHTQTPRICHIFVLSWLVSRSNVLRNAYFSWQTLSCQIVPVLPSYIGTLPKRSPPLVRRFTPRMDLRERSGVTCVNLHFRSVGVTCVNLCLKPQDLRA